MSGETIITVVGNLTADPDLKVTSSGAVVVTFTIASTPRTFDKNSNSWKDAESLFMRCSLWREAGEHAADSLTQGTRVIATGALKQRSYEKDGQKRTVVELDVEEIGPSQVRDGEGHQGFPQRPVRRQSAAGRRPAVQPRPAKPGRMGRGAAERQPGRMGRRPARRLGIRRRHRPAVLIMIGSR